MLSSRCLVPLLLCLLAFAGCGDSTSEPVCVDADLDGHLAGCPEATDCDDNDPDIHPGASERCNQRDDDCDQWVDEDEACFGDCRDEDSDGYPGGCVNGTDCDDTDASVHPGATELCNGRDDDCDGWRDEGAGCPVCQDADGDGFGAGCSAGPDCDDTDPACSAGSCCQPPIAWVEFALLDIWAQPLPADELRFGLVEAGVPLTVPAGNSMVLPLRRSLEWQAGLEAPEHETLVFGLRFDGSENLNALQLVRDPSGSAGHGLSLSHDRRMVDGRLTTVHTIYCGLRHKWFSAQGRPARRGNTIELMINGEAAWQRVHDDLASAQHSVLLSTWWWMSNFELVRDPATHLGLTPAQRWPLTVLGTLEARPARSRVLVGEFWGEHDIFDWITADDALKAHAENPSDNIEFMGQGNPTYGTFLWEPSSFRFADRVQAARPETAGRSFDAEAAIASRLLPVYVELNDWPFIQIDFEHASWHQKFAVVDDRVAYIGGMNVKSTDWDTEQMKVFEPRRMEFEASTADRLAVQDKERLPDLDPRRDFMTRIEGPAVQDAAEIFQARWQYCLDQGVAYAAACTPFEIGREQPLHPDGLQVQVTATMPQPFWEHAIAESWFNAVAQAERFILVEDQYWRIPLLVDAIAARMRAVPGLRLAVITMAVDEWLDPGCEWTYMTDQQLRSEFGPDRYRTYKLRSFDSVVTWGIDETESRFVDVNLHTKLLLVDDEFLSVGSCNKNNRGMEYEGELNVAVLDPTWVTAQRRRALGTLLPPGTTVSDDPAAWWQQLAGAAAANDAVYSAWEDEGWDIDNGDGSGPLPAGYTPSGFLYSLPLGDPDDCFFEGVGPDMTGETPAELGDNSVRPDRRLPSLRP